MVHSLEAGKIMEKNMKITLLTIFHLLSPISPYCLMASIALSVICPKVSIPLNYFQKPPNLLIVFLFHLLISFSTKISTSQFLPCPALLLPLPYLTAPSAILHLLYQTFVLLIFVPLAQRYLHQTFFQELPNLPLLTLVFMISKQNGSLNPPLQIYLPSTISSISSLYLKHQ